MVQLHVSRQNLFSIIHTKENICQLILNFIYKTTALSDYEGLESALTFTETINRICRNISIVEDTLSENNDIIEVFLETDDLDVIIDGRGEITILDDDST